MSAEKAIEQINERIKELDEEWKYNISYLKVSTSNYLHQLEIKQENEQQLWEYSMTLEYNRSIKDKINLLGKLYHEKNTLEKVLDALTEEK